MLGTVYPAVQSLVQFLLSVCASEAKSLFWVVLVKWILIALNKINSRNILQLSIVIHGLSRMCSVFRHCWKLHIKVWLRIRENFRWNVRLTYFTSSFILAKNVSTACAWVSWSKSKESIGTRLISHILYWPQKCIYCHNLVFLKDFYLKISTNYSSRTSSWKHSRSSFASSTETPCLLSLLSLPDANSLWRTLS